jgi:hypothetical protein
MEKTSRTVISINDYSHKVYRAPSKVIAADGSNTGYGLFAAVEFNEKDEVSNYSGFLKAVSDIKKEKIDPTYIFNIWQDMVICGDHTTGDLGIFANCSSGYQSEGNIRFK